MTKNNVLPFELRRQAKRTCEECLVQTSFTFARTGKDFVRIEHVVLSVPKEKAQWKS